ncbi:DUF2254 domain-containing protein [Nocardioides astragali]|uniref:DUF2254 domain-containing protein n=1 Tax=Nocardioides astragali TaxID=1776736 RepID=A0ABW2NAL9_9ACTN|nr:DUF2254 domain-containing protein [Nocardioides astragali]
MSPHPPRRWRGFLEETRTSLWPLPVAALVLAVSLGVALPRLDAAMGGDLPASVSATLFGGGAEAAQILLSAIATSLITVTSLTFSLTVVTLQLASSQYSPRLLRTFTRDRFVQRTLALFLGSFVYALTVLRTVRTPEGSGAGFVPQLSVTVAFAFTLASVLGLVLFLAHLAREIRVETVMRNVHKDADHCIERVLGERETSVALPQGPEGDAMRPLLAPSSGFVVAVRGEALWEAARAVDAVVVVDRRVGDAVVAHTPVARAWSVSGDVLSEEDVEGLQERLGRAVEIGYERTAQQDVAFGLRQLTDVAVKALSPGINDPTTAVHALNHSAALLCDLLRRDLGAATVRDDVGRVRVVLRQWSFRELLDLAVTQPRIYGADDPLVMAALLDLLEAVAWAGAGQGQQIGVEHQLNRSHQVIEQGDLDESHREELRRRATAVTEVLRGGS